MLHLIRRKFSKAILLGAKGYIHNNTDNEEAVRLFVAYSLCMLMRMSDKWPTEEVSIRETLENIAESINPVPCRTLAESLAMRADYAKKQNNKAAMYGFSTVGNWLMAAIERQSKKRASEAAQMYEHQLFFETLFSKNKQMLTDDFLTKLQLEYEM